MKLIAINGSPRKNWNTDTLLKEVIKGAEENGAEAKLIYLNNLNYKGCISCMACKLKDGKKPGRCNLNDDLTEVLDKIHEADALVIGSPIYWYDVTGLTRSFIERLLFQYLNYDNPTKPHSTPKKTAMIYTMNMAEQLHKEYKIDELIFNKYENMMKDYFKECTTLYATQTLFVKDYTKYHLGVFDEKMIQERHKTIFPKIKEKAYTLAKTLTTE